MAENVFIQFVILENPMIAIVNYNVVPKSNKKIAYTSTSYGRKRGSSLIRGVIRG